MVHPIKRFSQWREAIRAFLEGCPKRDPASSPGDIPPPKRPPVLVEYDLVRMQTARAPHDSSRASNPLFHHSHEVRRLK